MGAFPSSFFIQYILLVVDYASRWVEVIVFPTNDARVVVKFLKKNISTRFGTPQAIISDGGKHFFNRQFEALLSKYGVKHRIATPYHPQTTRQMKVSNSDLKRILEKMVNISRKDWALKIDNALWAYRTAFKTPIGISLYHLIYENTYHLLVEFEHRACWAMKLLNFDLQTMGEKWLLQLNKMDEFHNNTYKNDQIYKKKTKMWHDKHISWWKFMIGQKSLPK